MELRKPFNPPPLQNQAVHTSSIAILQDEYHLDQQSPTHFSPYWSPIEFHNQPPISPEWIDKLRGEHHFHHCNDELDDLAFRAQKTNDHPWDPNASTYYSEDSQDNDASGPCRKEGPKSRKKNQQRQGSHYRERKNHHQEVKGKKQRGEKIEVAME